MIHNERSYDNRTIFAENADHANYRTGNKDVRSKHFTKISANKSQKSVEMDGNDGDDMNCK